MTMEKLLGGLLENSPVIVSTLIITWLSLPQLAERFEIVAKVLRPLSPKWREKERREAEAAELREKAERQLKEDDRLRLLADAQAVAQQTATTATTEALNVVRQQCRECLDELHTLRDITGRLVDAVEGLMAADTPQARADARAAIRLARRAM